MTQPSQCAREAQRIAYRDGRQCPHCQAADAHEWNGQSGRYASYLCTQCAEQWDADEHFLAAHDEHRGER